MLFSFQNLFIIVRILSDTPDKIRKVKGLACDAVFLERYLIIAHGLELRRPRAEHADRKALHTVHDTADGDIMTLLSNYTDRHIAEDIRIDDICRALNISRTLLYEKTKQYTNGGIASFIRSRRL